ncbi:MAG: hypothetical protein IIB44_03780 [Candidatus Marinimicrobia bacterium]|nr:hypothetical protein [Candidatus Neomarinimicrobiota bacterium]
MDNTSIIHYNVFMENFPNLDKPCHRHPYGRTKNPQNPVKKSIVHSQSRKFGTHHVLRFTDYGEVFIIQTKQFYTKKSK